MPRVFVVSLLLATISGTHSQPALAQEADEAALRHARAAALPLLDESKGPELRVWFDVGLSCRAHGWRATARSLRRYVMPVDAAAYRDAPCPVRYRKEASRTLKPWPPALEALLPELVALDGQRLDCGANGTSSYAIEGAYQGRHFSLIAINPGGCPDAGAKQVSRLLSLLGELVP